MKHTIPVLSPHSSTLLEPVIHMTAAGIGELVACLISVPTDVVNGEATLSSAVVSQVGEVVENQR